MTPGAIGRRALRDRRRSLLAWSAGLAAYALCMLAVYPSVRDNAGFNEIIKQYPKGFLAAFGIDADVDFSSAAGYLNGEMFSFMMPALVLVLAISAGAAMIAGEEEQGTLDLLLAYPVRRWRVVVEKVVVLVAEVVVVGAVIGLSTALGGPLLGMHLDWWNLTQTCLTLVLFGIDFGLITLAIGAATGRRGVAIGVGAAAAVAAFMVNTFAALIPAIDWTRFATPFWYAVGDTPLVHGVSAGRYLVLIGLGLVATAAALVLFERRDLVA